MQLNAVRRIGINSIREYVTELTLRFPASAIFLDARFSRRSAAPPPDVRRRT